MKERGSYAIDMFTPKCRVSNRSSLRHVNTVVAGPRIRDSTQRNVR